MTVAEMTRATGPAAAPSYAAAQWRALGTYVNLVVADGDRLPQAQAACEKILAAVDQTCSRFREDSDLARANRNPGTWVRVDSLLIRALTEAVRVAEATGGLVDPTLACHLVALGYDRDLDEVNARALAGHDGKAHDGLGLGFELVGSSPSPVPEGWRRIDVDPDGAIRVPEGVGLDLGATGKAFAADLIAGTVPLQTGTALIISLGGDVAVGALDDPDADSFTHHWQVGVAERPEDARRLDTEVVVLEEGGLATSSTLARRWRHGSTPMHHLLDPRTGLPVDPIWRTASVCASSCLDANAASTAAIVMGHLAPAWLWEHDLAARLVAADGRVMRIAGWPDPER
jgi:thiamine biosynthesis lipoprotein